MANLEAQRNFDPPTAKISGVRTIQFLQCFTVGTILALACPGARSASLLETWAHRYGNLLTNAQDTAVTAALDSNGDLIVVGAITDQSTGSDILVLKYWGVTGTAPGTLLWQSRYDGPTHNNDVPAAVAIDTQGNVLVTGASLDEQGNPDGITIKYDGTTGTRLWEKRLVGAPNTRQELRAVAVDRNDNVLVTGSSVNTTYPDIYTAKYSPRGAVLWEKRYNSPDNSSDEPRSVAVDAAGNVVVAGYSTESDGYQDFFAAKYAAANGALLWQRRYQGQAHGHHSFYAVAFDSNNDVIAAGSTASDAGGTYAHRFHTAKFSGADGATRWAKTYSDLPNGGGVAVALAVDTNNNVITTGVIWNASVSDAYTAKYSASDGRLLWERAYNGDANREDAARAVALAPDGDVLISGYSDRNGPTGADYFTARYASNDGRLLWERHYNGETSGEDQATAVAVDHHGDVFVTGFIGAVLYSTDCHTVKYQGVDGSTLWELTYRGAAQSEEGEPAVGLDESGNVLMAGLSSYQGASGYYAAKYEANTGTLFWETRYDDHPFEHAQSVTVHGNAVAIAGFSVPNLERYVAKLDGNNGTPLWHRRYPGMAFTESMTMDGRGNVVVAGAFVPGFAYTNFYLAKHAATDGMLLWEKRSSLALAQEYLVAVTVDRHGDIAVTGPSYSHDFVFDFYTAKYAGENGALLWERRYTGNSTPDNRPTAITADSEGNILVTGASGYDYLTLKYSADGALLWAKRYDGMQGPDIARAIAVAANGDVVVTGSSMGNEGNFDYYTIRYGAAQGLVQWGKRYNGPANGDDGALAVAVDANNSVVVTGYSLNARATTDYLTLKYAGSNGDLLWEKLYNGPGDGDDRPSRSQPLALGPAGVVVVAGVSDSGAGDRIEKDFATVRYMEPPGIKRLLTRVGYQVQFYSVPGRRCVVQRAEALTGPWTTLATVTTPSTGLVAYDDLNPLPTGAFYRLSTP